MIHNFDGYLITVGFLILAFLFLAAMIAVLYIKLNKLEESYRRNRKASSVNKDGVARKFEFVADCLTTALGTEYFDSARVDAGVFMPRSKNFVESPSAGRL